MDDAPEPDRTLRAILAAPVGDGRSAMTDRAACAARATRTGLSRTPLSTRVRGLLAAAVSGGTRARLSARRTGLDHVACVEVCQSDTREQPREVLPAARRQIADAERCRRIAAGFDEPIKGRTRDSLAHHRESGENGRDRGVQWPRAGSAAAAHQRAGGTAVGPWPARVSMP